MNTLPTRITFQVPRDEAERKALRPIRNFVIFMSVLVTALTAYVVSFAGPIAVVPLSFGGFGAVAFSAALMLFARRFIDFRTAYSIHVLDDALLVHTLRGTRRILWNEIANVVSMRWFFRKHVWLVLWTGDNLVLSPPLKETSEISDIMRTRATFVLNAPGLSKDEQRARQLQFAKNYRKLQLRWMAYLYGYLFLFIAALGVVFNVLAPIFFPAHR